MSTQLSIPEEILAPRVSTVQLNVRFLSLKTQIKPNSALFNQDKHLKELVYSSKVLLWFDKMMKEMVIHSFLYT